MRPKFPKMITGGSRARIKLPGMWCMGAPREYGGGGLGTFDMCVLTEEMAQHRMGLYNPGCGVFGRTPPPVIYAGTEEQKRTYAAGTIKNAWHTFFAITEPSGGSDPAGAIQCKAVRQGDTYVLNGTKIFISHAHEAEWGVVFTRTDAKAGRKGITCFIIKKGTPGFTARPFRTLRTSALPNEVHFEDCVVPIEQRVGPEGEGLNLCSRFADSPALSVLGVQRRGRRRGAQDGDRSCQAAQHLRRAVSETAGDTVDARGFGGRAAGGAMADVGGCVEGGPRRGFSH